jgi:hypothetical protein
MNSTMGASGEFLAGLDQIETDWSMVHEPAHVVMRYSRAVQRYLRALIQNQHDAEEVAQEFFLWVSQAGLPRASRDRGRFRDYLKQVVRNTAFNFLRRGPEPARSGANIAEIAAPAEALPRFENEWIGEWRACILKRVWRRLHELQKKSRGSLPYTVLRLSVAQSDSTSDVLAERVSALTKKPMRADAYRQQLSRARRQFAQYLVDEVAQTLTGPEPSDVEDELADLHLIDYVREFLPLRRRIATALLKTPHTASMTRST